MRYLCKVVLLICVIGLMVSATFALVPAPRSALATAPTYWDQFGVWKPDQNRVIDTRDGRLQAVSSLAEGPFTGSPEAAARQFLVEHADWVGIVPTEPNLKATRVAESPMGYHVTFEQMVNGVPVYPGNLVVTLDRRNMVRFYFSSLIMVKGTPSNQASLAAADAVNIAHAYLKPVTTPRNAPQTDLVIWAGDNRDFAACWRVRQYMEQPRGDWEVLVDANTGAIRRVEDRACYWVNGTGNVYIPDPLTSAGATYGDPGYSDNNNADSPQLHAQLQSRTLTDITFSGGVYSLVGPWAAAADVEAPFGPPPTSSSPSGFGFNRSESGFEWVNVYFNIDLSQRWLQSLDFNNIQHGPLPFDAHGLNGDDESHYVPSENRIAFGDGGVDDAEDADVVWHEYGHAIQNSIVPGWGGNDERSIGEGFGDYWAASYSHSLSTFHDRWVDNWDGHNEFWPGRTVNANLHFPEHRAGDEHIAGMIYSQPCFEFMLDVGRTIADQVVVQSYYLLGTGASMPDAALAMITADENLYDGQHTWSISNHMVPRGLMLRPSNDTCPGVEFTSLPFSFTDITSVAAVDYAKCVGTQSPDVMFTMTLPTCQAVTASLCGSTYDTGLEIRSGGACPGSVQVACNDNFCDEQSQITFVAQAGVSYFMIVHGLGTHAGKYTLTVTGTTFTIPNDHCPGTTIGSLPYTDTGNTTCAAHDYNHAHGGLSPDVVYSYTADVCRNIVASLCGSTYDTEIEVRWSGNCPGDSLVAFNDDDYCNGHSSYQSSVSFAAMRGVTYYILVYGHNNSSGAYTLNVLGDPIIVPGDVCPGIPIPSLPYSTTGDTRCAAYNYSHRVLGTSPDVMYTYTPLTCQRVTASLCGSGFDTGIEVRAQGVCPGNVLVAWDDDFCDPLSSQTTFIAQAGVTYYIMVDGYDTEAGPYVLNVTGVPFVPSNDACPGTYIPSLPYTDSGNTRCATHNYAHAIIGESPDVVYFYRAPRCETVTVTLCGSSFDTGLEVRSVGVCPGSRLDAFNDDGDCSGGDGYQSKLTFLAAEGAIYYILVYGYLMEAGPYVLNVSSTPYVTPNDQCPGTPITTLPYRDTGDTRCAQNDYHWSCPPDSDAADVMYNLLLHECNTVTVTLCGSGYDTGLEIRKDGGCPGSTMVGCNDDSECSGILRGQSTITFTAIGGVMYYILVDGANGAKGPYVLTVTGVPFRPSNDHCPGTTIPSLPYSDAGDTRCADNDYTWKCPLDSIPDARDVWYNYTAPYCEIITATLCGSGYDTGLEVRTRDGCPGSEMVACSDDNPCGLTPTVFSTVTFTAIPGFTYYFIVDGYWGDAGPYLLQVTAKSCDPTHVDSLVIHVDGPDIGLSWSPLPHATGYTIYRCTAPEEMSPISSNLVATSTTASFVDHSALSSSLSHCFYTVTATLPNDSTVADVSGPMPDKAHLPAPRYTGGPVYPTPEIPVVDKALVLAASTMPEPQGTMPLPNPAKIGARRDASRFASYLPVYIDEVSAPVQAPDKLQSSRRSHQKQPLGISDFMRLHSPSAQDEVRLPKPAPNMPGNIYLPAYTGGAVPPQADPKKPAR
ncbi:MAG TPA: hypothetical protein VGL38_03890 [bacterium]|jgi:hypothetical protein